MAKRVAISTFVSELAAALKRGDGYIMGSYGQNPRTGSLDLSETKVKSSWKEGGWYYAQYSGSQRAQALKWRGKCVRVWDCNGMAEGIYQIHTGVCINARARNNYASWCSVKGRGLIPGKYRVPGAAVFWSGGGASDIHHVAYLYKPVAADRPEGDWYIIEARGVMYGVVRTKLLSRKPNYWGLMDKYFDYSPSSGGAEAAPSRGEGTVEITPPSGARVLKNGDEGGDVKRLQAGLIRLGYDLGRWGADGDFGDQTELALRAFQREHPPLEVNGTLDAPALAALDRALAALDAPAEDPKRVRIEGGDCYIRAEPHIGGRVLGVARRGDALAFGGRVDEQTRWLSVCCGEGLGWVSGKYGRLSA